MNIITVDQEFIPTDFIICEFYEEITYFCWNKDKLVVFPSKKQERSSVLDILTAPGIIKKILCFSGRVFLTCIPHGIYKFSRKKEFVVLSNSAVEITAVFYEVLTVKNNYLYKNNKQEKSSKMLFRISKTQDDNEICTFPLLAECTKYEFRNVLLNAEGAKYSNLCVIANREKLYKLQDDVVQLIYSCESPIIDIMPIQRDGKTIGLMLIRKPNTVVLMYPKDNKLSYDNVYLDTKFEALYAEISEEDQLRGTMKIIYADKLKLYYIKKSLSSDSVEVVKTEFKSFFCFQYYKPNVLLGLTAQKKLCEVPINVPEISFTVQDDCFINLYSNMLVGAESIVEKICEKSKELKFLNNTLQIEEDKIIRINLYSYKRKIEICPKMSVHRIANRLFLTVHFEDKLYKNTYIILSVKSKHERTFCIKSVFKYESTIEIYILENKLSHPLIINMDLITLMNEGCPWYVVKNFVVNSIPEREKDIQHKKDRKSFIRAKINLLKSLIEEQKLDMEELSKIKNSVRKEIYNT